MAKSELSDRLKQETVTAMKARDKDRVQVLRMLSSAVKQIEIDTREDLDDEGVVKVVRSYAKKVKDSIQGARDAGREDMIGALEAEMEIVQEFLPAEMDDAVLEGHVRAAIEECGATSMKEMGQVMKAAMARIGAQAEGGRVSAAVKKLLMG